MVEFYGNIENIKYLNRKYPLKERLIMIVFYIFNNQLNKI